MPLRTNEALPPCLQTRGAITNLPARAMGGKVEAISQKLSVSALELVHRGSTFRVLGGSRKRVSRWTPEYVKLLLSPRHSRGITRFYLAKILCAFSSHRLDPARGRAGVARRPRAAGPVPSRCGDRHARDAVGRGHTSGQARASPRRGGRRPDREAGARAPADARHHRA